MKIRRSIFMPNLAEMSTYESLLMLVTELKNVNLNGRKFETVLLSITGDLDLEKIGLLASKMNLPEELGELNRRGDY
jgi:hypothetical protein